MAPLYPAFAANKSGHLDVSPVHSIYWEECGLPTGVPILFLHGGPGAGCEESDRQYFDSSHYRSILLDQRGSGKSTPRASVEDNTTWDLVSDIEKLRQHLGIDKWIVFGGSWGSTLSLAYSEKHPDRCLGLILRGILTMRSEELLWHNQKGASFLFPDYFDDFQAVIPEEDREDMLGAYYKRLNGDNEEEKLKCADAWSRYGEATSSLLVYPIDVATPDELEAALVSAKIECHYFVNKGWMREGQLIEEADNIKHLPIVIIQGRYDMICPARTSWDLYKALGGPTNENVEYKIISDAGHSGREHGIQEALVDAVNKFKSIKA